MLQRTLAQHGLQRPLERRFPFDVWRAAVGPAIAARARPTSLSAGALHVLVVDHRWRDQLDAARVLLIERLNARLGRRAVRELRFGLAHAGFLEELAPLDPKKVAQNFAEALPPRCSKAGAELLGAARLSDELREAMARAAGAALSRARA